MKKTLTIISFLLSSFLAIAHDGIEKKELNKTTILADSDNDGVSDAVDLCPNTPIGTPVNAHGCPKTAITCDFTTSTISFNSSNGSTGTNILTAYILADSTGKILQTVTTPTFTGLTGSHTYMVLALTYNNDGSLNGLNIGNNLSQVSANCFDYSDALICKVCVNSAVDSDNDGVPDSKDLCPNTPTGTKVNAYGCPLESPNCDYLSSKITLNAVGGSSGTGISTTYVLADSTGKILQTATNPMFSGVKSNHNYMIAAFTYQNTSPPTGLVINNQLSQISANCITWSNAMVVKVCKPEASIADPCTCFRVEYSINEKKELYETVTVRGGTGDSWRVIQQTGMLELDSIVKHQVLINTLLTEESPGIYRIHFTHEDNIGYTVKVSNGIDTLGISNFCSVYPKIELTTLSSVICKNDPPIPLTASTNLPSAAQFFYVDKTTKKRIYITEFDPSKFSANDTIFIKLEVTPTDPSKCKTTIVQEITISVIDCNIGQIGSYIWKDINKNGIQDELITGVNGIKVILWKTDTNGIPISKVDSTLTKNGGQFLFTKLPEGNYVVQIVKSTIPANCSISTKPNSGTDDSKDSDIDPNTGFSQKIVIAYKHGENQDKFLTIGAGLVAPDSCNPTICVQIVVQKTKQGVK
jgi:hypothetical protein